MRFPAGSRKASVDRRFSRAVIEILWSAAKARILNRNCFRVCTEPGYAGCSRMGGSPSFAPRSGCTSGSSSLSEGASSLEDEDDDEDDEDDEDEEGGGEEGGERWSDALPEDDVGWA